MAIYPLSVSVCFCPCASCPWAPSHPLLLMAEQCSVVWTAYIPSLHWVVSSLDTGSSSQQPFSPHVISQAAQGLSLPGPRLPTHPPHRQPGGTWSALRNVPNPSVGLCPLPQHVLGSEGLPQGRATPALSPPSLSSVCSNDGGDQEEDGTGQAHGSDGGRSRRHRKTLVPTQR